MKNNWYKIENLADNALDVSLHDEIGIRGVSAGQFMRAIGEAGAVSNMDMSIHSPGGNFLDGLAIYNYLKAHPAKLHTHVRGVAGSAASLILLAGDTVTMPEDSYLMIHKMQFSGGGQFESDELRDIASTMDKFEQSAVNIYQQRTGMSAEEISAKMAATSWIGAKEARELGFIDAVTEPIGIAAKSAEFSRYFNEMPFIQAARPVEDIKNITEFEKRLRDAGLTKGLATALTSRAKDIFRGDPEQDDSAQAMREIESALMQMKIPASLT